MASKTVWGQTDDGLFEFVTLTDDLMEDALDVIREGFCRDESICLVTEVDRNPAAIEDLVELSRTAAADGVTVVAVERRTGIVAAVLFNKIQRRPRAGELGFFEAFLPRCKHPASRELIRFMIRVDARVDLFKRYATDCLLELMFLATRPAFRRASLATGLCTAAVQLASSDRVPGAAAAVAIFTSGRSQRVSQRLNFAQILAVSYDEFNYCGQTYTERLHGKETCATLCEKRVTK